MRATDPGGAVVARIASAACLTRLMRHCGGRSAAAPRAVGGSRGPGGDRVVFLVY